MKYWVGVGVTFDTGRKTFLSTVAATYDEAIANTWAKSGDPAWPVEERVIQDIFFPTRGQWNEAIAKELLIA